jgi:2-hydroxychromene-2-carboxylate isomerase
VLGGKQGLTVVEFLYDFASPNCYVAYHKLREMTKERGLELRLSPVFLGGLFQITNDGPVPRGSHEYNYMVENLERISRSIGIAFSFPHSIFPLNSVKALRGSYFAETENTVQEYVSRVFEAYWAKGMDISDPSNLGRIIETLGFDRDRFFDFIEQNETKLRLRRDTGKAYERGVFGAPTYFIDGQMFWGTPEVLWYLNEQLSPH